MKLLDQAWQKPFAVGTSSSRREQAWYAGLSLDGCGHLFLRGHSGVTGLPVADGEVNALLDY